MFGNSEARRAALYRQLAALEDAGIPLATAVQKVADPRLKTVSKLLDDGAEPGAAWELAGFTSLEVALVKAGAKGGMLVATFRDLEQIFEDRAAAARRLLVTLAYPVGVIHLAVLLPQLSLLLTKGFFGYAEATIVPLMIAWAVLIAAIVLVRAAKKTVPGVVDGILGALPAFGGLVTKTALAHALHVLGALYKAGIPVREAVDKAADAATLYQVRMAFLRVGKRLDAGLTIGDAFFKEEALPLEVREAASTGSISGQLDETLAGAERRLKEDAKTRLALILTATPVVVFLFAALMVAITVINFYSDYFNKINDLSK